MLFQNAVSLLKEKEKKKYIYNKNKKKKNQKSDQSIPNIHLAN